MKSKKCSLSLIYPVSDIKDTLNGCQMRESGSCVCLFLCLYLTWFQKGLEAFIDPHFIQQMPGIE